MNKKEFQKLCRDIFKRNGFLARGNNFYFVLWIAPPNFWSYSTRILEAIIILSMALQIRKPIHICLGQSITK